MSTFNGLVKEFPNIRIDYFRPHPGRAPPAAYLLSHVHSDHLLGLESVKMPFVYCSDTTKRILLKMEKYPHRINFAKGVLEARKQHYRHLKTLLRALPLNTMTELELGPKFTIRVTLLDANHCPGAVMFLIEGDGKAIIYTGDTRAEPWWVNSIVQNPVLLPYTCGLKILDCIYLDTTFASHDESYREFPTKAEGLMELLQKIRQCPADTVFYFRAWTLGYENVWVALSNFLQSQVHVDEYQLRLFRSTDVTGSGGHDEGASLTGFTVGNHRAPGCLTRENNVKIHSCEPGLRCHSELKKMKNIKWITPIISRLEDGTEVRELGAGGGAGDLYPTPELKLDDPVSLQRLVALCMSAADNDVMISRLTEEFGNAEKGNRDFTMPLTGLEDLQLDEHGNITLKDFVALLSKTNDWGDSSPRPMPFDHNRIFRGSSKDTIHFPYSRHSSYNELRHLVGVFRPKDICPCTVGLETWSEEVSMQTLFGDLCCDKTFRFDQETRQQVEELNERRRGSLADGRKRKRGEESTQETETRDDQDAGYRSARMEIVSSSEDVARETLCTGDVESTPDRELKKIEGTFHRLFGGLNDADLEGDSDKDSLALSDFQSEAGGQSVVAEEKTEDITDSMEIASRRRARIDAYKAARLCLARNDSIEWDALPLRSVGRGGHEEHEDEL